MRAATLVRSCLIVMFVASIGVAGTTVVLKTAETFLAETDLGQLVRTADQVQPVQADQLERQLRAYQVRLSPAGELGGRVNIVNPLTGIVGTAQDMKITFLQNGEVIAETHPGLEGKFQVPLLPGVYSVVGAGPDGYMAYALQVLPAELTVDGSDAQTQPVAFQEVLGELAIDTVAVPVSDLPTVMSLAHSNIPPELLSPTPSGPGATTGPPLTPEQQAQFTNNRPDVSLQGHQVQIRPDGRLVGRMHRINQVGEETRIRRLNVFLVQDNQVIAQAPVSELGSFEFFDVGEGVYSFVAAGMDGLAVFTMQAVSGPNLAGVPDELTLVSMGNLGDEQGTGSTTDSGSTGKAVEQGDEQNPDNKGGGGAGGTGQGGPGELGQGTESGGNGGGGGSTGGGGSGPTGGGGGFGSGASGMGALLAGIAAGVAGYAIGDNNNNDNNRSSNTVSPAQP